MRCSVGRRVFEAALMRYEHELPSLQPRLVPLCRTENCAKECYCSQFHRAHQSSEMDIGIYRRCHREYPPHKPDFLGKELRGLRRLYDRALQLGQGEI